MCPYFVSEGRQLLRTSTKYGTTTLTCRCAKRGILTIASRCQLIRNQVSVQVAIIVPTLNAGRTLRRCLESLRLQSEHVYIVVVDAGSTDDTLLIASEFADCLVHSKDKGFSSQRNQGAEHSVAAVIGFIDADMVLEEEVVKEVLGQISDGAVGVVVPEVSFGSTFWARVRAFERSFYRGPQSPEAARFFRRDSFVRAGGYDERLSSMEDFAMDRSVRALGIIGNTQALIRHDEGALSYTNACRKKAGYASGMASYFRIYGKRQLGEFLFARDYIRYPFKLMKQPLLGGGVIVLKVGETFAVLTSLLRDYRERYRHESSM